MPQVVTAISCPEVRNRAALMEQLRRLLPGVAEARKTLPFGLSALDSYLPNGGLACGALHEIVPEPRSIPATFGFIVAILARITFSTPSPREGRLYASGNARGPLFLVLPAYSFREFGRLHGHGLRALGLDPARLILVETSHRKETLWAIEEALHSGAPAAVAGVIDKLDLRTSQRLHLAATDCGLPLLLLRPAQNLEASAAATRWRVGTAEAARDRFGLITRPRWHLRLERCRNGRPGEWVVEYDHVAHRFSLAATLADPARASGASKSHEELLARTHCA
ncbi:MAG: ImuA protein [Xanthobacteraceae bacterium]